MGRWAQAQRRGGVGPDKTGLPPAPPVNGDWTVSSPSAGQLQVVGVGSFPAGVASYLMYYRLTGSGPYTLGGSQLTKTVPIASFGLTSAQTYDVVIAWGNASQQQSSAYSPIKTQVIT
jgi:hypothetical protein